MACRETVCRFIPALLAATLAVTVAEAQQPAEQSRPVRALTDGISNRLETALAELTGGRRSKGMMAVDEAHRVLQVGKYVEAYPGPFAAAEKAVKEIRRLLQNGQADDARQLLGETVTSFAAAEPPKLRALAVGGGGYRGATLIDVQGKILGEFDRVNSEDKAIATIGGWQDALGFIDIGGETMNLRLDQLIFGPNGTWGEVFVVTTTPVR